MKLTTPIIKEGAKMKKPILTVLFVAMFVASSMLVLLAHSTPDVPTTAYLYIMPNPIGVNQPLVIIGLIDPEPPNGDFYEGLMLNITDPDDTTEFLGPFTSDPYGAFWVEYTPSKLGTYYVGLNCPEQTLDSETYLSSSVVESFTVGEPVDPTYVSEGYDVPVFPHPEVGLVFDHVIDDGHVQVNESVTGPPPDVGSLIGPYYYVTTTAEFEGNITVQISYDEEEWEPGEEEALCIIQTDIILGDVNLDGKVNFRDLIAILLALGSRPGHRRWNPSCDLNKDNKVNICDLWIVLKNYGKKSQWIDITLYVDTVNNIIIGQTDHLDQLDPFGIRR